ncbi:cytochrome P450 94A1-like protein [Tanacetum coccineum]
MMVSYHPYAMGMVEELWGADWMEFRPERWLEKDEMAEKSDRRSVLGRFKVVSTMADNVEPVFVSALTSKMKGGFPVKIKERK